jgi:proline dehydrogenase
VPRRTAEPEPLEAAAAACARYRAAVPRVATSSDAVLRHAILAAADSARLQRLAQRHGFRLGAARFVAGETLDEAVRTLARLEAQGLLTNTTLLGEGVREPDETRAVVAAYRDVLERIRAKGLRTNVAIKLTQLGLAIDEELAYANVAELVGVAAAHGNFIRIDMEESAHVDATLRTYRRLRDAGHANVGIVLQSYLYRSEDDLRALLPLEPNLRIVKGAYLEPPELAYPDKADVDAAYVRLVELSLLEGGFTAVATHDERLIERTIAFARVHAIPPERYQFQLLYGVRPQLQLDLVARGHSVLVATPYGPEWYRYLMRRLAERPANLLFFLRNALRR